MSEENIPISGIACDMTVSITAFGKGADELFGYTIDEVIGKGNVGMFHTEENVKTSTFYGFSGFFDFLDF